MDNIELDYGAITIDNDILKNHGYKFDEGLLAQLAQFKSSPVTVIFTDIVHNEAVKHIGENIEKTRATIASALRSAEKQLNISEEQVQQAQELLDTHGTEREIADTRLHEFYQKIGAEKIISNDFVELRTVMNRYFDNQAPFENNKEKKHEFPDAISLLTLENWALAHNTNILAVSKDKGWNNFAEDSEYITVVPELANALAKLQPHSKVTKIIELIRESAVLKPQNVLLLKIEEKIKSSLEDSYNIDVNGDSYYFWECSEVYAVYQSHELAEDKSRQIEIEVVSINENSIVLKVEALIKVIVHASFDFSIRDSIDKDYVSLGSNNYSQPVLYDSEILLTLEGDFSKDIGSIEFSEIEVLNKLDYVDFEEIGPNFHDQIR